MQRVGVISDTHGLLRPEALAALEGVDSILHAGDIGSLEILEQLAQIAPVTAVRGNNDREPWARRLPEIAAIDIEQFKLLMIHDRKTLTRELTDIDVLVFGHSHKPENETRDNVLFLNPGSAGPRRFKLPVSVGRLEIARGRVTASIIELTESVTGQRRTYAR